MPPTTIEGLPPELFTCILLHVPPDYLQQTALSLTRALARIPIARYHLFTHVRLVNATQVVLLDLRLRRHKEDVVWIDDFKLETWTVDADVACNLISRLPKLANLTLFIGPNFAPEHLEQIFSRHVADVQCMSLRFRPYVKVATYYQFLKGAYFDTTLLELAQWPHSEVKPLLALSIVQDPMEPEIVQRQRFAQPLVFFRLAPLTILIGSKYLASLKSFRLRIPGRQFVKFLCAKPGALANLELLDVSTSMIAESEVETLLGQFTRLRHLLLDHCNMKRLDLLDGEWAALGKSCATAGVKRAKEREKKLREWLEANNPDPEPQAIVAVRTDVSGSRPRRGRRGIANATISLRERDEPPRPVGRVSANVPKIRILPSPPTLTSLAITATSYIAHDKHDVIRADFERGWSDGLAQLNAVRSRLRHSWNNGIRVVRFAENAIVSEDGLDGLVDVDEVNMNDAGALGDAPLLCLVGSGRKDGHVEGCGHSLGWEIWRDDL